MKKLMIAAAVAVVAGGAFADDGYNFTATLKTTQGKKGTDIITTINLGKDVWGDFWYMDADYVTITNKGNGYWFTTKTMTGASAPVPTVKKTQTKDGVVWNQKGTYLLYADGSTVTLDDYKEVVALLKGLGAKNNYDQRSAGQWCETIKVIDPANCYRVAGTKKIDLKFYENLGDVVDCCTDLGVAGAVAFAAPNATNWFENATIAAATDTGVSTIYDNGFGAIMYNTNQVSTALSAITTLYQRFGSQEDSKANRLEIYAAVPYALTTDGFLFAGWIAGQGTAFARDGMAANTISGNIVGVIEAPVCEYCCSPDTPSVAFDCLNETAPAELPYSAAYGTFRLRYVRNMR